MRKRPSKRRIKARMHLYGYLTEKNRFEYRIAIPSGWRRDFVREVWFAPNTSVAIIR
jgi:hypothetical protein